MRMKLGAVRSSPRGARVIKLALNRSDNCSYIIYLLSTNANMIASICGKGLIDKRCQRLMYIIIWNDVNDIIESEDTDIHGSSVGFCPLWPILLTTSKRTFQGEDWDPPLENIIPCHTRHQEDTCASTIINKNTLYCVVCIAHVIVNIVYTWC